MMKITKKLQEWLVANKGVSADASEDDLQKAAAEALIDSSLNNELFIEMTKDPDAQKASALEQKLDAILCSMAKTTERIDQLESKATAPAPEESKDYSDAQVSEKAPEVDATKMAAMSGDSTPAPSGKEVNLIEAHTQYDSTKSTTMFPMTTKRGAPHPYAGQRAFEGGGNLSSKRYIDAPSERDMACSGAYLKWTLGSQLGGSCPYQLRLTEHDKQLLMYSINEEKWCGEWNEGPNSISLRGDKLPAHVKAVMRKHLIDEVGNMGGQEIVPYHFDDAVILPVFLHGEVFPRVNVVTLARGSRVEGGAIGVGLTPQEGVTFASVIRGDAAAITPFETAAFVTAFNTNIYVAHGGIQMGLDFLSDSPVDVATIVANLYSEALMVYLDDVVCTGDGTTQPDGVLNYTGIYDINAGGDISVGLYEDLMFAVRKQYRRGDQERIAFVSNENVYAAARALAVTSGDERRVFGMETNTHKDYRVLGYPYAINNSFDTGGGNDQDVIFGNFARYRMYRRAGLTLRTSTEGESLMGRNMIYLVARARFGGQIEDPKCFAQSTDMTAVTDLVANKV